MTLTENELQRRQGLAAKLRAKRAALLVSRFRLAVAAGCSPSTIQAAEYGFAGEGTYKKLFAALDREADEAKK
jgi:hypothetical protein